MTLLSTDVNKFSQVKALVIGDIMLDRFIYGKVVRISPEAPVPIFQQKKEKQMLGGAGNVVANLVTLGCKTTFIGIVGNDINGATVASLLRKSGAHSHILKIEDYTFQKCTSQKLVQMNMEVGMTHIYLLYRMMLKDIW